MRGRFDAATDWVGSCATIIVRRRHGPTAGPIIWPYGHAMTFFDLFEPERRAVNQLLDQLRVEILQKDSAVSGFNIGMNSGEAAGQTVDHAHVHMIPRRKGDVPDPRGGVRGVIPGKASY